MEIKLKRVYEAPEKSDGYRILVDRIWPRGMTKEKASVDLWLKEIGPSNDLRKWFGHDPEKWVEFKNRYMKELETDKEEIATLKQHISKGALTLVYSAKDEAHNQAVVIKEYLNKQLL
ncbi:MAG: DUF488 domain-containing protein [Chitinophagaceae bacterium]